MDKDWIKVILTDEQKSLLINGNVVHMDKETYYISLPIFYKEDNQTREMYMSTNVLLLPSYCRDVIDNFNDGYHSFKELYDFRLAYNANLFNEWGNPVFGIQGWEEHVSSHFIKDDNRVWYTKYQVHKSWKHHDGEYCFGKEKKWFIVSAMLPTGLISNHYKAEHWDMFKIPETEKALFEFDGHTGEDVLQRLKDLVDE